MPTTESQLHLRGFQPEPRRLRRARGVKTISRGELSAVVEEVMADGLAAAYRESAQSWLNARGAMSFRETDEVVHVQAVSPTDADSVRDLDSILVDPIYNAFMKKVPPSTLAARLANERKAVADGDRAREGQSWEHLFRVFEVVGKVYTLQPGTIRGYKKQALRSAKKNDPRLR